MNQVSYYVFDRGYNAFKELYKICLNESYFVVRAKKNLQYKCTEMETLPARMCFLIPR